jgi:hypothetical protein
MELEQIGTRTVLSLRICVLRSDPLRKITPKSFRELSVEFPNSLPERNSRNEAKRRTLTKHIPVGEIGMRDDRSCDAPECQDESRRASAEPNDKKETYSRFNQDSHRERHWR